jgi:hypothetical protein
MLFSWTASIVLTDVEAAILHQRSTLAIKRGEGVALTHEGGATFHQGCEAGKLTMRLTSASTLSVSFIDERNS